MKRQFNLFKLILLVVGVLTGIPQAEIYATPSFENTACAQASLQVIETSQPGEYKFIIDSDKPFINLGWHIQSYYNLSWGFSSGTRWEYTGTHAEIVIKLPFNGRFRVGFNPQYKLTPNNQYCTVSVSQLIDVAGLSPCSASISSTIYGKAAYEFSYAHGLGGPSNPYLGTVLWEFGDGSTSSAYKPKHVYAQDGTYTVKLTRSYSGCSSETYHTLKVGCEDVQAKILSEKYDGPGLYSFYADVPEEVKSYNWDFGDGGSWVNRSSVAYKFDYDGTYPVTYTATTIGGCTVVAHDVVTITDAHLCGTATLEIKETDQIGKFNYVINSTKPIKGTNFDLAGIDNGWAYSSGTRWDWNGAHLELSPYKIPYNGPVRVALYLQYEYAQGKYCSFDLTDTFEVRGNACTASITATENYSGYKFSLTGNNLGKAGTGTTLWEFGDGTTSTSFEPTHNYQQTGTYTVKVKRTYSGCTAESTKTITVCDYSGTPVPMQEEPTSNTKEYKFSVASGDRIVEAYWGIDSYNESTDAVHWAEEYYNLNTFNHEIKFQFNVKGQYSVWAFFFTEHGCYGESYKDIEIQDPPSNPEVLLPQSISFHPLAPKTYGDAPFELTASATSSLPITYTSSNNSILEITGQKAVIRGAGSVTITAYQSGNDTYEAAPLEQQTLIIDKAVLTATADFKSRAYGVANPGPTISYSGFKNGENISVIDMPPTAVIAASATLTSAAGTTHSIEITGGVDGDYTFSFIPGLLTIDKAQQSIEFSELPDEIINNTTSILLKANASSGLPVSYSVKSGPASALNNTIQLTGEPGVIELEAVQPGNNNFFPASTVRTLSVIPEQIVMGDKDSFSNLVETWPNPATGTLYIRYKESRILHLSLIDLMGRKVLQKESMTTEEQLDIHSLTAGVYLLLVKTADNRSIIKHVQILK